MINSIEIWCTADTGGGPGAMTGTAYSDLVITGVIESVYINGTMTAGTIDLADEKDPTGELIIDAIDGTTEARFYPRRQVEDNSGNGLYYDGANPVCERYVVNGRLKLTQAGANPTDRVKVIVWFLN